MEKPAIPHHASVSAEEHAALKSGGGINFSRRLIGALSILLIAGFLGTSIASYLVSRASLRREIIATELPLTSDTIYSEIQKDLIRPQFVASMMASDTFLRDWMLDGEKNADEITRYLSEIKTRYTTFTSFLVSEKTHNYYHYSGVLKQIKEDEPRDVWYFRVREMTPEFEINVDVDLASHDVLTIFLNHKVFDYDGHFIGATGVGLTVDAALAMIRDYQVRFGREVYLVNKEGKIAMTGMPDANAAGLANGLETVLPRALKTDKGSFQYYRNGDLVHLNTRYIPELGWYLFVAQVEKKLTTGLWNTLLLNLLVCGVIVVCVLLLTAWVVKSFQAKLEFMAMFDKLTHLLNRQVFDVIFAQVLRDVQRSKTDVAVVLFDIDHFKLVNDQYGHLAGDEVLQGVARTISSALRKGDPMCRWGGEEFLVLLRSCPLSDAIRLAEKIRGVVAETAFYCHGKELRVTISAGVTVYGAGDNEDTLISRADNALYAAKEKGRNRIEVAE